MNVIVKRINILLVVSLIVLLSISITLLYLKEPKEVLKNTSKDNSVSSHLSIMVETGIGTGTYEVSSNSSWPEGYLFNADLSRCENGSKLSWDDVNNKVIVSGNTSDKCYVYFDVSPYKYWNENFECNNYYNQSLPTGEGLYGTFSTRSLLTNAMNNEQDSYSTFETMPIYIKTTQINGSTYRHTTCLWYNDHEFCIAPNYWTGTIGVSNSTEGVNTKNKLKADMEVALGVTASSCTSSERFADCDFGSFGCSANLNGVADCYSNMNAGNCTVFSDGRARCC